MPPASFLSPGLKPKPPLLGALASHCPRPSAHTPGTRGRAPARREPQPHSQDTEREGSRHALAVSDQEAAIAACPGQQLLGGSAAQVAVVPGGGRAAQRAPGPRTPRARRPAGRGHSARRAQRRPRPPPRAIRPGTLGAEAGAGPGA